MSPPMRFSAKKQKAQPKQTLLPSPPSIKCSCCKLIFPSNAKRHHIFGNSEAAPRLQEMLTAFLVKPIVEKVGTDQAICDNCLAQLEQSYAFKMRCLKLQESDHDEDDDGMDDGQTSKGDSGESRVTASIQYGDLLNCEETPTVDSIDDQPIDCENSADSSDSTETPQANDKESPASEGIRNTFSECLDVNLIKNCLRNGTPIHQGKRTTIITNGSMSTKSNSKRRMRSSKLPTLIEDDEPRNESPPVSELALYPYQSAQLDIDQYLKSLVSVQFGQLDESDFLQCCVS